MRFWVALVIPWLSCFTWHEWGSTVQHHRGHVRGVKPGDWSGKAWPNKPNQGQSAESLSCLSGYRSWLGNELQRSRKLTTGNHIERSMTAEMLGPRTELGGVWPSSSQQKPGPSTRRWKVSCLACGGDVEFYTWATSLLGGLVLNSMNIFLFYWNWSWKLLCLSLDRSGYSKVTRNPKISFP